MLLDQRPRESRILSTRTAIINSYRECQQHKYQKCGKHSGGYTVKELGNLQFRLISHNCVPFSCIGGQQMKLKSVQPRQQTDESAGSLVDLDQ